MSGSIYQLTPYQQAVYNAMGVIPGLQTAPVQQVAQPSYLDQLLAMEQGQAPQAPGAPSAPDTTGQQQSGGGGGGGDRTAELIQQGVQAVRAANTAGGLYRAGQAAYNAYQTGGLGGAAGSLAGSAAGAAIPAAAGLLGMKAGSSLAKPGGELGAQLGGMAGGFVGGMAGGAAAGAAAGSVIPVAGTAAGALIGALLGSSAGGQIGPTPSVGPNFGAVGTLQPGGAVEFTGFGGDNGGNSDLARDFASTFAAGLPELLRQRGLEVNPAAVGQPISVGYYAGGPRTGGRSGAFYIPSGQAGNVENYAAFFNDPERYSNFVLADMTARNLVRPIGSEDTGIYNVAGSQGQVAGIFKGFGPTTYEGFLERAMEGRGIAEQQAERERQEAAAAAARQTTYMDFLRENQLTPLRQADEIGQEYQVPGQFVLPDGTVVTREDAPQAFAKGGQVIELQGGGKVAVGPGGGLDDLIPTSINGRRAAALSDGEFVVPADVVSMMGDGSSNAGARRLYDLVRQIRESKTGTSRQAGPLPVGEILKRTMS